MCVGGSSGGGGGGGEAFAFVSECRTFISQWKLIEFGQLAPDECTSNEVNERNGGDMFCKLISKKITIQIELSPPILPEKKLLPITNWWNKEKQNLKSVTSFVVFIMIALH